MRRLWRILVSGLTVLSLLLCLAFAGLWVRSHWRLDSAGRSGGRNYWRVDSVGREGGRVADESRVYVGAVCGGGGLAVGTIDALPGVGVSMPPDGWHWNTVAGRSVVYPLAADANRWGFGWIDEGSNGLRRRIIILPLWLPTALFATLPLGRGTLFMRRRRVTREGYCRNCGYDLRATPERCPECGAVPVR